MWFVAALFYLIVSLGFLLAIKTVARRQGVGTAIAITLWGLLFGTFAVLDFAQGFGHPLLSSDIRHLVFAGFVAVCLLSLPLIRKPKQR